MKINKNTKTKKIKNKKFNFYYLIIALAIGLVFFGAYLLSFTWNFSGTEKPKFGVTFSKKYAQELGLDWTLTYLAVVGDLRVSHIRLIAYWDEIEKNQGEYNFNDLDWQVRQATDRGLKIQLILGRRTPRWPECHDPLWLKDLEDTAIDQKLLDFVSQVVTHYKENKAITMWQVENEPLLSTFGICPKPNKNFLEKEVALVKSLDSSRDILVSDSGELSSWQSAATVPDILGTTLYRIVWNKYFGFFDYFFLPPAYYHYKASLTQLFHPNLKEVIVTELQMEPWTFDKSMIEITKKQRESSFNLSRFNNNINYVSKTGFNEVYFWGVEYWYWLKVNGEPEIWDQAKKLW